MIRKAGLAMALSILAMAGMVIPGPAMARTGRPAPSVPGDIAPILAAEARREAGMNANDAEAIGRLLSTDLVYIHANGLAEGREAYLARLRLATGRYRDLVVTGFTARRDGRIAISQGDVRFVREDTGLPPVAVHAHFLAVWRNESGTWRLLAYASPPLP
ncbi:nuclear transport factor 2 family protein [Novosphingobium bradum]|uniref:Nuclear transport factor 2 family protein n=1 Tax=Novosphingobium bradum TaxID=1737444 RepID=A0ABV7IPD6_9SPHN